MPPTPALVDTPAATAERQRAVSRLRLGPAGATLKVDVTATGLLAIGALVSSILLSTAVIVHVATRAPGR